MMTMSCKSFGASSRTLLIVLVVVMLFECVRFSSGFLPIIAPRSRSISRTSSSPSPSLILFASSAIKHQNDGDDKQDQEQVIENGEEDEELPTPPLLSPRHAIRAPLRYVFGGAASYLALRLCFPKLTTRAQREQRNDTTTKTTTDVPVLFMDFVLDTGATTNTINAELAKEELALSEISLPSSSSSSTTIVGAGLVEANARPGGWPMVKLGDAALESTPPGFIFMRDVAAAALPVASPAPNDSAGLLGLNFFQSIPGGVDLFWGRQRRRRHAAAINSSQNTTEETPPPCITFYAKNDDDDDVSIKERLVNNGREHVWMQRNAITQLVTVMVVVVNKDTGDIVEIPALLDTGSPITIFSPQAAQQTGIIIETSDAAADSSTESKDVLKVFGAGEGSGDGPAGGENNHRRFTNLVKSAEKVAIWLKAAAAPAAIDTDNGSSTDDDGDSPSTTAAAVPFGEGRVFIGELPGLEAMKRFQNLTAAATAATATATATTPIVQVVPDIVLGLDVLMCRPQMYLNLQSNQLWF